MKEWTFRGDASKSKKRQNIVCRDDDNDDDDEDDEDDDDDDDDDNVDDVIGKQLDLFLKLEAHVIMVIDTTFVRSVVYERNVELIDCCTI